MSGRNGVLQGIAFFLVLALALTIDGLIDAAGLLGTAVITLLDLMIAGALCNCS